MIFQRFLKQNIAGNLNKTCYWDFCTYPKFHTTLESQHCIFSTIFQLWHPLVHLAALAPLQISFEPNVACHENIPRSFGRPSCPPAKYAQKHSFSLSGLPGTSPRRFLRLFIINFIMSHPQQHCGTAFRIS